MKSINELLVLLLDTVNADADEISKGTDYPYMSNFSGLCGASILLRVNDIIDDEEWRLLRMFIINNRPTPGAPLSDPTRSIDSVFYWSQGAVTPRVNWLEYHIKKN